MGVPQFTTPDFTLTFSEQGLDLTQADQVYVTFTSGMNEVTKSGSDLIIGEKTIGVFLDQAETGRFKPGTIRIQANWIAGGKRIASDVVSYVITEQLLRRVIE